MFCINCGKEITNKVKFCQYCGRKVNTTKEQEKTSKNNNKKKSVVILVFCLIIVLFFVGNHVRKWMCDNQYQYAIQFEMEFDYEKAVKAYEAAQFWAGGDKDIEEKLSQVYLKWAERYCRFGNEDGAIRLLEEASISNSQMQDKLNELKLVKSTYVLKTTTKDYSDNTSCVYEDVFDEKGNCIRETTYDNDLLTYEANYEYDEYDNVLAKTIKRYKDVGGGVWITTQKITYVYEYDSNGNAIKIKETNSDSGVTEKNVKYDSSETVIGYEIYDEQGVLEEKAEYDEEKEVYIKSIYENGELKYKKTFDIDGKMLTYCNIDTDGVYEGKYIYDDIGNIQARYMYRNGVLVKQNLYSYDDKNRIKRVEWCDGEGNYVSAPLFDTIETFAGRRGISQYPSDGEYQYDESGNLQTYIKYDENENLLYRWEYTYDINGNKITQAYYNGENHICYKYEFKYDERGNEIEEYYYDENGNIMRSETKEYMYIE